MPAVKPRNRPSLSSRSLPGLLLAALLCAAAGDAWADSGNEAQRFHEDAQSRLARNDAAGAIIQARNAVQRDPDLLPAHLLLGKALLKDGQAAAAEAEFEIALRRGASMAEVAQPYAQALMMFGNSEKLLDRIKPDGLPAPLKAEVLAMRATAMADLGDLKGALATVAEARALAPKSLSPLRVDIDLALRSRDPQRARQDLALALGMAPQDAQFLHLQGALLQGSGDAEGALRYFAKALEADSRLVDARIARASLLIDLKRPEEALPDLDKAAAMTDREPRVAYLKSLVLAARGDAAGSRKLLEEVAKLVDTLPDDFVSRQPPLLMLGGLASQTLGRAERARALLELYVKRMPQDPAGRKFLANMYLQGGNLSRVADLLDPLLRSGEADTQVLTTLAALRMQQGRHRDAAEILEAAARLNGDPGIVAQLGFARIANQQPDLGLPLLRKAFDRNPAQPDVATALSTLYLRRGDTRNALLVAEALVRQMPQEALNHNLLGVVRAAARQPAEARAAYLKALELKPGLVPAQLNLARLDITQGRADAARERLTALVGKDETQVQALTELARLELRSGGAEARLPALEKAHARLPRDRALAHTLLALYMGLDKPAKAQALAAELVRQQPQDPDALEALGRAHLALGQRDEARNAFASLIRVPGIGAERLVEIGRLQLAAGAGGDAALSAEKALAAKPGHLPALVLQVEGEVSAGDLRRAERLQRSLAARPAAAAEALRLEGDIALARQQPAQALRAYRLAFDKTPSSQLALRAFQAAYRAGTPEQGIALLDGWLRRQPDDLSAHMALAEGNLRLGRLPAARAAYEAVLARDPANAAATNNLAQVLQRQKDVGALAMAEKAVKLAPKDANALDTLGWLRVNAGALDVGLRTLREARVQAPASRDIRYHLAWTLHRAGQHDEARTELLAALKGRGEFESESEAQALRRELGV